jgi:hypothetical protein
MRFGKWLWVIVFMLSVLPGEAAQIPKPRPKPIDLGGVTVSPGSGKILAPEAGPAPTMVFPKSSGDWPQSVVAAAQKNCQQILAGLNMAWRPVTAIGLPGGCGTASPIIVSAINGVALEPEATFNCPMAVALYQWLSLDVQPAARAQLGQKLLSIQNASSYVCRRRNGQANGKMSEHAIANAFDMASFTFADGSRTTVAGQWSGLLQSVGLSKQGNFLRASRKSACEKFTTVLGPGSDKYHGDHFHVDLAYRKSGYRICK